MADSIFKCILTNETFCISIQISVKFVPNDHIGNASVLVQVTAWRRTGEEPLPEPKLTQFTQPYICSTRERWIKLQNENVHDQNKFTTKAANAGESKRIYGGKVSGQGRGMWGMCPKYTAHECHLSTVIFVVKGFKMSRTWYSAHAKQHFWTWCLFEIIRQIRL